MNSLLIGISLATTFIGLAVHILWWRIRRPADDVRALALVMGVLPLLLSVTSYWFFLAGPALLPGTLTGQIVPAAALAIMHGFIALVYMSCYTAAQAASPTVLIVLLARHDPAGVTKEYIESHLTDDLVCGNLVQAAIHEKFVAEVDGALVLDSRGRGLRKMGRIARKLAGLSAPGG